MTAVKSKDRKVRLRNYNPTFSKTMTQNNIVLMVPGLSRRARGAIACEQALLFGRAKRVARECASKREGPRKGEFVMISHKFSFVLHPDEGKYHWLKNGIPEIKVD